MRISASTQRWLDEYYAAFDAKRVDDVMRYWAPDGVLRFGNDAPIAGTEAIEQQMRATFGVFSGMRHTITESWEPEEGVLVFEADVTYIVGDGPGVTLPAAAFCRIGPGHWLEQRIYSDVAPVFAEAG